MKRKEDDLAKIDGKYLPIWARVLAFILSFAVAFLIFYFLPRLF